MSRVSQYINALLESFSEEEFSTDEERSIFSNIRDRLLAAPDMNAELKTLFRVQNLSDFALALMWVADRVGKDSSKAEYTPEERTFVISKFYHSIGDLQGSGATQPWVTGEEAPSGYPGTELVAPVSDETQEETPRAPAPESAETGEAGFAALLERFVEAMQSGVEERDTLLSNILEESGKISAERSGFSDDIKEFCQVLIIFLQYVWENVLMDDVRVMNILSNISGPVVSWAATDPEGRKGLLVEATEILRDSKSMFE